MSNAFDLLGLAKALAQAADFIKADRTDWRVNPRLSKDHQALQEKLRTWLPHLVPELAKVPELKAWAKMTAEELNEILKREGFNIHLDPWPKGNDHFGVVSILDLAVQWLQAGDGAATVHHPGDPIGPRRTMNPDAVPMRPAFRLDRKANQIEFFEATAGEQPLIKIPTQSGDVVWIQQGGADAAYFDLYRAVETISMYQAHAGASSAKYAAVEDVTIPKIKLRTQVDIGWLLGFATTGELGSKARDTFKVSQAKQEVRFVMNEVGARAKTATAIGMIRSTAFDNRIRHVVVNGDFLLWIERPGLATPVFVSYLTKEDWADPGSLANV